MNPDLSDFREVAYGNGKLFFDKRNVFHEHFRHKHRTRRFPHYKNALAFLAENPGVNLYFTLDESIRPFRRVDQGYIIHMDAYQAFCRAISSSTRGRIRASLSQHVNLSDVSASAAERDDYIKANATEQNIVAAIEAMPVDGRRAVAESLRHLQSAAPAAIPEREVTVGEFLRAFARFLGDKEVQAAFVRNTPQVQIQILRSHIQFLRTNLNQNETFIQNWIDEEDGKHRKQRCLIFGVEYVDPKREGRLSGKRFDVLAEQNRNHHVIVELKSPNAEVFDVKTTENANGGQVEEYCLSKDVARAIPQILGYKKWYEGASSEERLPPRRCRRGCTPAVLGPFRHKGHNARACSDRNQPSPLPRGIVGTSRGCC